MINVKSEIMPLKRVLLHRPGNELLNLTPDSLTRLLFDDIPYLKIAREEHDEFARILRMNGVEVVYLEDLMAEIIASTLLSSTHLPSNSSIQALDLLLTLMLILDLATLIELITRSTKSSLSSLVIL